MIPVASASASALQLHDPARAGDAELMAFVAAGDADAFDELYRRHHRRVLGLARKLCASSEQAEEIAQEAFVSMWRGAHQYRPALGSVPAWMSTMVRNRAIDAWRRAAIRPVEVAPAQHGRHEAAAAVVADTLAPERTTILTLIGELPPAQKEAVFLAYFGGMSHSEIARRADAPVGTIKGRIRLGLEKLRLGFDTPAVAG